MHHDTAAAPHTEGHVIHWARWYDRLTNLLPFTSGMLATLVELAAPAPGEQVLDVGCGTGTLALMVKARIGAGKVYGIDASPEMIEVAKEKASKAGAAVELQVALVEALPFPDATFDLVTSTLVLHHLPGEVKRKGLEQVRRVLKPGGRFLVADFAAHSHSPIGHLLSLLGRGRGSSTDELIPLLKACGFADVEVLPTRHGSLAFLRAR